MPERGRCSWVDAHGRCPAREDLIRHQPRHSAARLLCPKHLKASLEKERGVEKRGTT